MTRINGGPDTRNREYHADHWRVLTDLAFGSKTRAALNGSPEAAALLREIETIQPLIIAVEHVVGQEYKDRRQARRTTSQSRARAEVATMAGRVWSALITRKQDNR